MEEIKQFGPDGQLNTSVKCSTKEALRLYKWMFTLRDRGYRGPFLLEGMLAKIRREI